MVVLVVSLPCLGGQPVTVTGPDGRERSVHAHEFLCLWYKPFHTRPVKVILIRNPGTTESFNVAIASTDVEIPADQLLSRYDSHWTIEACNQGNCSGADPAAVGCDQA